MSLEKFVWRCASSASPSATWAFLFNFPCPVANVTKDLQEKCEYHRTLSKYFCLHFLIDPIFILQNIDFCSGCLSRSYEICIQTTFSRWRRCKRIQIVNFKSGKTRAESTCSSCWASGSSAEFVDVAKKIMKTVSLSSTQQLALECVCFRFLLAKAPDSACGQNP